MKLLTIAFSSFMVGGPASGAPTLTEVARYSIPEKFEFQSVRLGGLSSLWYNTATDSYWAVSDDRGKFAGPRMYELGLKIGSSEELKNKPTFEVIVKSVYPINEDEVPKTTGHGAAAVGKTPPKKNAKSEGGKKLRLTKKILDLEAGAPLPWGNLLLSSEGDFSKKPRTLPRLLEVKTDGTWVRDYDFPDEYVPEKSGKQTRGITNNNGAEGITALPSKDLLVALESALFQDDEREVRWLRYSAPEAWSVKPIAEYVYPMASLENVGQRGISDVHALSEDLILVTEREYSMGEKGLRFLVEFFLVDLREKTAIPPPATVSKIKNTFKERFQLKKSSIGKMSGEFLNIEAVEKGPVMNGKPTLLMLVDNNFVKGSDTEFILMTLNGVEPKK